MEWYNLDTWIVITGALCASACAIPGCFLVLRQMSMMGDAISHAVLPGLAIAFMITGSRSSLSMFVGAAVVGVLTALFSQWISQFGKVDRGASMGIVFTSLFALGLILIVQASNHVELDASCVLYGALELTPLDLWQWEFLGLSFKAPRAACVLATILVINITVIGIFYKEFKISSFDPALAKTLGIHSGLIHYLLMTMVAITTVAAFEAVGSIIVIAMLVVPAATAYLLTENLVIMMFVSVFFSIAAAILGHISAILVPSWFGLNSTSSSAMIAVMAGCLFLIAWIFAPKQGLLQNYFIKSKSHNKAR